jgi:hypothetical protein
MLAYPIPEAESLLESKLSAAQQSLDNCEEDLDFLREQITVSEPTYSERLRDLYPPAIHVLKFLLSYPLTSSRRLLRLRQRECTTGMSPSAVKTRRLVKV